MMEVEGFSEESVHFYQTTECHIHDSNLHATVCLWSSCSHKHSPALNLFFHSTAGTSDIW